MVLEDRVAHPHRRTPSRRDFRTCSCPHAKSHIQDADRPSTRGSPELQGLGQIQFRGQLGVFCFVLPVPFPPSPCPDSPTSSKQFAVSRRSRVSTGDRARPLSAVGFPWLSRTTAGCPRVSSTLGSAPDGAKSHLSTTSSCGERFAIDTAENARRRCFTATKSIRRSPCLRNATFACRASEILGAEP